MSPKARSITGWILTGLLALAFLMSAFMKLTGNPEALKAAAAFGLSAGTYRTLGIIEILSVLLFIFPRTGLLGTLLLAAYLGGAIASHLEHQVPVFFPAIMQCLLWITAAIRFPELSKRLIGNTERV